MKFYCFKVTIGKKKTGIQTQRGKRKEKNEIKFVLKEERMGHNIQFGHGLDICVNYAYFIDLYKCTV